MPFYSSDARVHDPVAALLRDVANPYGAANGGIPMIVAVVRANLGDAVARSVRITVH